MSDNSKADMMNKTEHDIILHMKRSTAERKQMVELHNNKIKKEKKNEHICITVAAGGAGAA